MDRAESTEKNFLPHNRKDDAYFALFLSVMKNETAHRNVLSIIMGEKDLELKEVHVEEVILNRSGQRAILPGCQSHRYIGTQFRNRNAKMTRSRMICARRARFYQGLMDTPVLKSGRETRYKYLPPTIITFITQKDIFGKTWQSTHLQSNAKR